jgi:hypothetical protein
MVRVFATFTRQKLLVVTAGVLLAAFVFVACGSADANPHPSPSTVVYRFGVVGNRGKIAQLERSTPTVVAGITGEVVQIATSNSDDYALTSSGSDWAWGVGSYGELGNGTTVAYDTRAVKVAFPAGVKIHALANPMPFDGALAIDSSGHLWGGASTPRATSAFPDS